MKKRSSFSYSSSSPVKSYHVFLSFRGEDTRYNFTGHLSRALREIGLFNIFRDDYALPKGTETGPELLNAIQDSHSAVVVLSKNYADSHWCLKEIAKIVECMGDSGRIRTIFYHVNPSDVKNQKGSFGEAMKKHENDPKYSPKEVESWRNALTKIGSQFGYPIEDKMDESNFIQQFVADISSKLGATSKITEGLFGMDSRLKKLDSYVLQSPDDEVCFIGIQGACGIGKSTLARVYYKIMSHKYEGCSFLSNVREVCDQNKGNGLVHLQNQLLSDTLKGDFKEIRDVESGKDMIRSRLYSKKVLVVLDDVNEFDQLKELAGEDKWFGSGSVIIMTSKDESLLRKRWTLYRAEQLEETDALQLFSSIAFESDEPPEEFKELSDQVVKYAENLPLALTVFGSLFHSKRASVRECESTLRRLMQFPAKKIIEKLRISFDDLEKTDQQIFLDIACFFKGHDINKVQPILDSCGFEPEHGIKNLIDRSLLEIKHGRILWMRDLMQKMGLEIVQPESGPSRLWDVDEFKRVLGRKTGMENVEAIIVNSKEERRMLSFGALSNMEKLRLLMILGLFDFQGGCSTPKLDYLSNELQVLEWNRFPFEEFPSCFEPSRLVELKLFESNLRRLWNCYIKLPKLKVINLKDSRYLITFGDFSVVPNLERLILEGCIQLSEIDPSITLLGKLTLLNLRNCTTLQKLPEDIGHIQSLKQLDVRESGIEHLPSSISCRKDLETLIGKKPGLSKIRYDIYLSFRGDDIPNSFTSPLYNALIRRGYKVFIPDKIERGQDIGQEFLKGIEVSRCSIVFFSENYARSRWCLTELAMMVKCMEGNGRMILPIFYQVDPSHVLKQNVSYGDALKVASWRDALTTVGNLPGWVLENTDIDEQFTRYIIEDISHMIKAPSKYSYSSEMLDPSHGNLSDESLNDVDPLTIAFISLERHFQVLSRAIKNKEFRVFRPRLEKIKIRLHWRMSLLIDEELGLQKSTDFVMKVRKECADLIGNYSDDSWYQVSSKSDYKDKLDEFDECLWRMIMILEVYVSRNPKEMHDALVRKVGSGILSTASCDVPQFLPSITVGLDGPLDELKKRLLNTDKSLLLVTGMGGCGKTLLAQKFCHDPQVQGRFKDNIFFVTFSKTPPTLSDIVQQLYNHKRKEMPFLVNEVEAVEHLENLLNLIGKTAPILLVLDDVWDGSKSLIKKLVLRRPEYKILVTSRYELQGFGPPEFSHPYRLSPLNDKDTMTLFRCWASLDDQNSSISYETVKKMVDYFKLSLPVLKIVAATLYGKTEEFWKSKLKEYSNASFKLSSESNLVVCMQSLLEGLDAKVKECLVDLGSFPEDHRIPVVALIDMWTELYNLDEEGDAVDKLLNLVYRNLVNLIITRTDAEEEDGYYNKHFVTLDRLLRDLTMNQSSNNPGQWERLNIDLRGENQLPNWWHKRKDKTFSARLLTISSEKKLLPKLSEIELPGAKALVLNFWSEDYALPEFVGKMERLKALIVTSYMTSSKSLPAELKNFELLGPLKNLRRIRLERISIPSLTLVSLENLQKISMYMCSIGKAFSNCSTKISYLFPNLREMNVDFCKDLVELPAEICDIHTLEKLTISHCPNLVALPEEIGKLENLKELRLRACISLIKLPDSISKLSNLTFLDIYDCTSIESLPEDIGDLRNLSKLNMTHCSRLRKLPWSVSNLKQLEDLICDEVIQELWEPFLSQYLSHTVMRMAEKIFNLNWLPKSEFA